MEHLLEMRNLSIDLSRGKRRRPVKLVEGIDLNIDKKQNFGVVGESGCGKSITCSSIMGLLSFPLSVGRGSVIRFQRSDGSETDLLKLSKKELQKLRGKDISMIFQEPMTALDPMYTIEDQIVESLRFHTDMNKAQMHEAALDMLKKVKIPRPEQILTDYPHHLSGGMLQRVMIAIALINNPRLLIADEPTTALDVTIQAQILELMKDLQRQTGMGILFITHNLGVVAELCHKVCVMYAGKLVEQGAVDDIFYRPGHPYTEGLLRSMPRLDDQERRRLIPIQGTPVDLLDPPAGCPFAPRCPHAMEVCLGRMPPYVELGPGHRSACWLRVREGLSTSPAGGEEASHG